MDYENTFYSEGRLMGSYLIWSEGIGSSNLPFLSNQINFIDPNESVAIDPSSRIIYEGETKLNREERKLFTQTCIELHTQN